MRTTGYPFSGQGVLFDPSQVLAAVRFTEGRVVGPCWEKSKPKGPKGFAGGVSVSRCCRGTEGKGESLRVVVPRQNLAETSRSPCVSCTAGLCTATTVFHGLPLLISDA